MTLLLVQIQQNIKMAGNAINIVKMRWNKEQDQRLVAYICSKQLAEVCPERCLKKACLIVLVTQHLLWFMAYSMNCSSKPPPIFTPNFWPRIPTTLGEIWQLLYDE